LYYENPLPLSGALRQQLARHFSIPVVRGDRDPGNKCATHQGGRAPKFAQVLIVCYNENERRTQ
jgi:hypothetical protein